MAQYWYVNEHNELTEEETGSQRAYVRREGNEYLVIHERHYMVYLVRQWGGNDDHEVISQYMSGWAPDERFASYVGATFEHAEAALGAELKSAIAYSE